MSSEKSMKPEKQIIIWIHSDRWPLTFVVVDKDVLVSREVFVIVAVTYGDGQGVGATNGGVPTVLHDDWHVILLLLFPVKRLQTRYNAHAISIATSACSKTNYF